jgi:O-antigen/teichoic acid export membrane protein
MLNIIATTFAFLRTVGVVPLIALRPRIEIFFIWQLIAIVGETIAMRMLLARTIGSSIFSTRFSWTVLRSRAKLSLSIAISALFWASMTQIDKLILSKVLPLAQFSVFSLATLLAGGIMLVTNPIQQAFIPRLNAESFNGGEQLFQTYVLATEVTSVAVIPVATIFFFVPGAVFRLWSESVPATQEALLTLQFYAIGNACWAIASIQYFVQYAKGDLSLHLKGTLGFIALSIPALLYAGTRFGVVGVASVWLGLNAVFLFGWVAVVHRIFLAGINGYWYRGVLSRVAAVIPAGLIISRIDSIGYSRIGLLVFILGTWIVMVALTLVASPIVQRKARYLVMRMIPS